MAEDTADDLATWVVHRDEAAFHRLVERHSGMVSAACRRQLGVSDAADEAVQAVFIILARRANTVSDPSALGSWLYRVALGVCHHARRAAARRAHHEQEAAMRSAEDQRATADAGSEEWAELRPRLDDAIATLHASEREVVIGHFLNGLPQGVVAERLGISESAARRRIATAVDKMRAWFSKRGMSVRAGVLVAGLASEAHAAEPALSAACTQAALHPASAAGATALASSAMGIGATKVVMLGLAIATTACVAIGALAGLPRIAVSEHVAAPGHPARSVTVVKNDDAAKAGTKVQAPVPPTIASAVVFHYDFEDGLRPATLVDGDLVPGPQRVGDRFCVAGLKKPQRDIFKNEVVFAHPRKGEYLFTYREGMRLRFDCWYSGGQDEICISLGDETQHCYIYVIVPHLAQGRWNHIQVGPDDFRMASGNTLSPKPDDLISDLLIATNAEDQGVLYVDNLELTSPR